MSEAVKELVSSGALGATLVVVMAMLGWLVKVLVASFVRQTESVTKAMTELVEASRAIRDNCRSCRTDSLQTLRDAEAAIKQKVEHAVAAAHDGTFRETERMIGESTTAIKEALTGVAQSIRSTNAETLQKLENKRLQHEVDELSRPNYTPAPAGGGIVQR